MLQATTIHSTYTTYNITALCITHIPFPKLGESASPLYQQYYMKKWITFPHFWELRQSYGQKFYACLTKFFRSIIIFCSKTQKLPVPFHLTDLFNMHEWVELAIRFFFKWEFIVGQVSHNLSQWMEQWTLHCSVQFLGIWLKGTNFHISVDGLLEKLCNHSKKLIHYHLVLQATRLYKIPMSYSQCYI